jgi:hypothetical protein
MPRAVPVPGSSSFPPRLEEDVIDDYALMAWPGVLALGRLGLQGSFDLASNVHGEVMRGQGGRQRWL